MFLSLLHCNSSVTTILDYVLLIFSHPSICYVPWSNSYQSYTSRTNRPNKLSYDKSKAFLTFPCNSLFPPGLVGSFMSGPIQQSVSVAKDMTKTRAAKTTRTRFFILWKKYNCGKHRTTFGSVALLLDLLSHFIYCSLRENEMKYFVLTSLRSKHRIIN